MKTKQMKKNNLIKTAIFSLMLFVGNIAMAQSTISGSISDSDQQPLPGVNIIVNGSNSGASSDFDGNFTLKTSSEFPFSITISSIGFGSQTI